MLTKETLSKILSLYKKNQNDISLFSSEELKLLLDYFTEHSFFSKIKETKGIAIFKKTIYNTHIKEFEKREIILKYDEKNKKCNIFIFGEAKKKNIFKETKKLGNKKYLNCNYKCLTKCFFAEFDYDFYLAYILVEPHILFKDFIQNLKIFPFSQELSLFQYQKLFLNYDEKIYNLKEIIYKEGDEVDGIYLIIEGECQIIKQKTNIKDKFILSSKDMNIYEGNKIRLSPIFPNNINKNKAILSIKEGDLFGDLELNKNFSKRQFSVICSGFIKSKIWFFPIEVSKILLKKIKQLSNQKSEIIKTRTEYSNLWDRIKFKEEKMISNIFERDKNHCLNEVKFNKSSLSVNNLKNALNNQNSEKQEKKLSSLFLTSCMGINKVKNNNNIKLVSKEKSLNNKSSINSINSSNNSYNEEIKKTKYLNNNKHNCQEINLFRKKRINMDIYKKIKNKNISRNKNLNPINICFLENRITIYCDTKENTKNKNYCKTHFNKYNYKTIDNSSNNDTWTSNNKLLNSFDYHENYY